MPAVEYTNPFKAYVSAVPSYFSDPTVLEGLNAMRACLLTGSWWDANYATADNDSAVQVARINSTLSNQSTDFFPPHNVSTGSAFFARDYAPILIDIEWWLAFSSQGVTEAEAFTSFEKVRQVIDITRGYFPNRPIAYYGWTPHNAWYAIKNWHSVRGLPNAANYASYLSVFTQWKRENERVRRGGTADAKNNDGPLKYATFCTPDLYLPSDTNYNGATDYTLHPDCIQWAPFFRECTAECKRVWQKPCIPYIQPFKPTTTTYLGNAFFTYMMDTALADPNCDGFIVYFPTAVGTAPWGATFSAWVTANLLD